GRLQLTCDQERFVDASRAKQRAGRLWDDLELLQQTTLSARDLNTLNEVTRADVLLKLAFIEMLMASEAICRKFNRRPEAVARALVALDDSLRLRIFEFYVFPALREDRGDEVRGVAVALSMSFELPAADLVVQLCKVLAHDAPTQNRTVVASADESRKSIILRSIGL